MSHLPLTAVVTKQLLFKNYVLGIPASSIHHFHFHISTITVCSAVGIPSTTFHVFHAVLYLSSVLR